MTLDFTGNSALQRKNKWQQKESLLLYYILLEKLQENGEKLKKPVEKLKKL